MKNENGKKMLLTADEISNNKDQYRENFGKNLFDSTLFHFITPHQEILDDYLPLDNIHIQMQNYVKNISKVIYTDNPFTPKELTPKPIPVMELNDKYAKLLKSNTTITNKPKQHPVSKSQ